ncbi:Uncharacterised protein [Actinobacillus equuli]|nr:Uncharacterised protein [Actinobacillus equuli]
MDDIIQELLKELEDPKVEISRSELQNIYTEKWFV